MKLYGFIARAAYYQWPKQEPSLRARQDELLREKVVAIHRESRGTYGAPRVHQQLRRDGVRCGRKRVAKLMGLGRFRTHIPTFVPWGIGAP